MSDTATPKRTLPRVLLRVLIGVLIAAVLAVIGFVVYLNIAASPQYGSSERAFVIPGLDSSFVPQALTFDDADDTFLVSGYTHDGPDVPLFFVRRSDGSLTKTVHLLTQDGHPLASHCGGIQVHDDYLYVAGTAEHALFAYDLSELARAADGTGVAALGTIDLAADGDSLEPAFVGIVDGRLVVGEFNKDGDSRYDLHDAHPYVADDGTAYQAVAAAYDFSGGADAVFGLAPKPAAFYYLPDLVQGIVADGERLYLTFSWAISSSIVSVYDLPSLASIGERTVFGQSAPAYLVDSSALVSSHHAAPMAEQPCIVDGKLHIMNESACAHYFFGRLNGSKWCYALPLEQLA